MKLAQPSVLVAGGAGYIGSHMVKKLARAGWAPTTLDNLSVGHRDAVIAGDFLHADLLDRDALSRIFAGRRFDLVMHFAAPAYVGESMVDPRKYYTNNVIGTLNLLHAMLDAGTKRLIFSSSCATYGLAQDAIAEDHSQQPINPYGRTKLVMEWAMRDYGAVSGLSCVALRYFNAAGADRAGELHERHDPETHLIPLILMEAARVLGGGDPRASQLVVLGDDYATPDGTCVRDYVHVEDLCSAHLLAAERVLAGDDGVFEAFNLGNESGVSVLEVIRAARRVTGVDLAYRVQPRRPGDAPQLVCSARKARKVLGWQPEVPGIEAIIETAWPTFRR